MLDKLSLIENHYEEITMRLSDPSVLADPEQFRALSIEHSSLTPLIETFGRYKAALEARDEAKELLDESGLDPEFREMAAEQLAESNASIESLEQELRILLLPKDPNDEKNVIVEIRGGAGGDEAALFAHSLFRMYSMYAEKQRWKIEVLSLNATELGGVKEISFNVTGQFDILHAEQLQKMINERDEFNVRHRRFCAENLTAELMELAQATCLRTLVTEARRDVARFQRKRIV